MEETKNVDISSSLSRFTERIGSHLRKQKENQTKEELEFEIRKSLIKKSLVLINKTFKNLSTTSIGDRYYFQVIKRERNRWPMLILALFDKHEKQEPRQYLCVFINDFKKQGTLTFELNRDSNKNQINLKSEKSFKKLKSLLKLSISNFLKTSEEYITDVRRNESTEKNERYTELLNTDEMGALIEAQKAKEIEQTLAKADVFNEELNFSYDNVLQTDTEPNTPVQNVPITNSK